MLESLKITESETEQFLKDKYGSGVTEITQLGSGAWSHAFTFTDAGEKSVIRWSNSIENFDRDAVAATYNQEDLPVPAITDLGRGLGKYYAVSSFAEGEYFEELDSSRLESTMPSILQMFRSLRNVDLSDAAGFGRWNKDERGDYKSWREFLLSIKNDPEGRLISGWSANLEKSDLGREAFDNLYAWLETIVDKCPEVRQLVHSDLLNHNVLSADNKISAVLDWGSSIYGDSLYDIAWFLFYEPWYPNFSGIKLPQRLLEDFIDDPTTNKQDIETRITAYKLHIALDSIAYNAFRQNWKNAQEVIDYTKKTIL